jgi:hypothetical protein|tara:strand:- start:1042 stop:1161 length:120 start_codon:yes stop_codon:yes gene_type:complete
MIFILKIKIWQQKKENKKNKDERIGVALKDVYISSEEGS